MIVGDILNRFKDKIISIRGNCDSEVDGMVFDFPCNAAYGYIVIQTENGFRRVFLTHGHLHKFETKEQISKLGLNEGEIVLSGHTHVSGIFRKESGIININPGSISIPKGGTQKGFAFISENAIELYNLEGKLLDSYNF
jgi:putative phosphoesterase